MPTYPADAAGVRRADGIILSGDDTPKFRAAGYQTIRCCVQCSEKIAAGEHLADDCALPVTIAVDLNGATLAHVAELTGVEYPALAVGIYNGETHRSLVGTLPAGSVPGVHARLLAELPGFGCFAVLT